ncbi:hypothetical protein PGB90_006890 [Kerria lacca]
MLRDAYPDNCVSPATCFRWQAAFLTRKESINKPRGGDLSTAIIELLVNTASVIIREDRRMTVRALGEALGISKSSAHVILSEHLHMKKVFVIRFFAFSHRTKWSIALQSVKNYWSGIEQKERILSVIPSP